MTGKFEVIALQEAKSRIAVGALRLALVAISLLVAPALAQSAQDLANPAPANWPTYGRNQQMWRYSPLTQITADNVATLQLTWSRTLNEAFGGEISPTEYNGVLYVDSTDHIWALDATNGNLLWTHKVTLDKNTSGLGASTKRGGPVVYQGHVFWTTGDGRLFALDAKSGTELWSVQIGNIQYGEGFTSDPIFADGKIIVGPSGADTGGVPGRIIAYDATDGEALWTFHTIPQPGQPGFDTWQPPTTAQWGGGSAWNPGAYDPQTKTVIYGVGNATPAYRPGSASKDLYTGSWVALDVNTGKLKWYFQVAPHDEWDADQIPTPTITDVTMNGQKQHVALLPSVNGFLIVVDAGTGKYLTSYKEAPKTTVVQGFQSDGTPIINQSAYYTDSGQTHLVCPFRWVDFEPAAFSPDTGLYYRPESNLCSHYSSKPLPSDWKPGEAAQGAPHDHFCPDIGWCGAISAFDPSTGKKVWTFKTPYPQYSGPVVTKGGLVFIGSPDRHFRAFNASTGKMLWQQVLPALISGNPISYDVGGVQYVAVPEGGNTTEARWHLPSAPDELGGADVSLFVYALPGSNSQ